MPTVGIHQPEFLPWLGFFDKLQQSDVFVLLDSVPFEKNYFQNRNRIRTPQGWSWLTVPVLTKGRFGQSLLDVRIRPDQPWRRKHCQSLEQHYGRTPFFREYFPALRTMYDDAGDSLVDLNLSMIRWLSGALGVSKPVLRSSALTVTGRKTDLLLSICQAVGGDTYLSGPGGRDYLDEGPFERAGIAVRYHDFAHPEYEQLHAPFLPRMSAIDLLFNHGPQRCESRS